MFEIRPHRIKSAAREEMRMAGVVRGCAAKAGQVLDAMNRDGAADRILAEKIKEIQDRITMTGINIEKYGQTAEILSDRYERSDRAAASYQVIREYGNATYQNIDLRRVMDKVRHLGQIRM